MEPKRLTEPYVIFTDQELDDANERWGCNCGPAALAAMLTLTPDDVHGHIPAFDKKRYTNAPMMKSALRSLGVVFDILPMGFPRYGLIRIQFEGRWTQPGVPPRVALRYTHWVGTALFGERFVYDVNSGWMDMPAWESAIIPLLTEDMKGANGKWHTTHRIELRLPCELRAVA